MILPRRWLLKIAQNNEQRITNFNNRINPSNATGTGIILKRMTTGNEKCNHSNRIVHENRC
jgi:hypothetical protein